jgi:hypothetical protein
MVAVYLASVSLLQLAALFVLERTRTLSRLTERVFLHAKDSYPGIKDLFGDVPGSSPAANMVDVLRVTDLISGLFGGAMNLLTGAAVGIAIGIIGTNTRQGNGGLVTGAYIAGAICVVSLIVLLVVVLADKERDYPPWAKVPKTALVRAVRKGLSPRTPYFYKLIVLITSGYLVVAASLYTDPTQVVR